MSDLYAEWFTAIFYLQKKKTTKKTNAQNCSQFHMNRGQNDSQRL